MEKLKKIGFILAGFFLVLSVIGTPRVSRVTEREDAKILRRILQICPPLPENSQFTIPGYKSLQCFYKVNKNGARALVTDLNEPVSIPKPVEE